MVAKKGEESAVIRVVAPKRETLAILVRGTTDLVMNRFPEKAQRQMVEKMEEGQKAKTKRVKPARDFDDDYKNCFHVSEEGWHGIPCMAFKAAICDCAGDAQAVQTKIKRNLWIEWDGVDPRSRTYLVKITKGKPEPFKAHVMNGKWGNKVADIRNRPRWSAGWEAVVRIKYDPDIIPRETVVNLLNRAGSSCGILEGRNNSKTTVGQGWGEFEVVSTKEGK